jgi:hypothetical protein
MALTGAGALPWARGNQKCKGTKAVFSNKPVVISISAAQVIAVGSAIALS